MKRRSLLTMGGLVAIAVVLATGCANDSPTTVTAADEFELNDPYGGYSSTDELPAFGDPDMAGLLGEDEQANDPLFSEADVDSMDNDSGVTVYVMVVRWGMLEGDSANETPTDWSGSAELLRGGIAARRLIHFEQGEDYIVRPRTSRTLLEWVSQTTKHFDGMLLVIADPLGATISGALDPPNTFTFTTDPYTHTFTMDELADLDLVVDVDALGNQIAFHARKTRLQLCGGGPMEGYWVVNPSGKNGNFFGKWMNEQGTLGGHLRGHFGVRDTTDEKVFFGKFIAPQGHFLGFVRGHWDYADGDSTEGTFAGEWVDRGGAPEGMISGRWQSSGDMDADSSGHGRGHGRGGNRGHRFDNVRWSRGFFSGWWTRECDADSGDGTT